MIDLARAVGCSYGHLRMAETTDRAFSIELMHKAARELTTLSGTSISIDDFSSITAAARRGEAA